MLDTSLPVSLPPMISSGRPNMLDNCMPRSLDHQDSLSRPGGHALPHEGLAAITPAVHPGLIGGVLFGQNSGQQYGQQLSSQAQTFAASFLHQSPSSFLRSEQILQSLLAQQRQITASILSSSPMAAHTPFGACQSLATTAPPTFASANPAPPNFMTTTCLADFIKILPHQPSSAAIPKAGKRKREGKGQRSLEKRTYVKAACLQCRSSHLACDDGAPCRNCIRNGGSCERGEEVSLFIPPSLEQESSAQANKATATRTPSAGSEAPTEISGAVARKYVKAACSCCRKAHLACDNFRPCRSCMHSGLNCEEVRSQRRRRYQLSDASSPAASDSPSSSSPATQVSTPPPPGGAEPLVSLESMSEGRSTALAVLV